MRRQCVPGPLFGPGDEANIGSEFTLLAINVSVLFRADSTPALAEVYVQVNNIIHRVYPIVHSILTQS